MKPVYTILNILLCIILFWSVVKYGAQICEGYSNINSSKYSHTVNLPLTDTTSCGNFCGPQSQCVKTREQCTSDIDCKGCIEGFKGYDGAGKLGQSLTYSPLTTGYDNHSADFAEIDINAEIKKPYKGVDMWEDSFNRGIYLYNKKRESYDKYNQIKYLVSLEERNPNYPLKVSMTGTFYETTPPASNSGGF